MKHNENETYEMVPMPGHEQAWAIRILEGVYNETVVTFGEISFNEDTAGLEDDEAMLSFNFNIVESPDTDLSEQDVDFQQFCGKMLEHIIVQAIENQELEMKEREDTDNGSIGSR